MQFVFANSSREIATSANSWVSTTGWFYQQLTDTSAKELYQEMAKPENWFTGVYTGKKVLCQETYATEDEAADKVGAIAKGLVWAVRHDQPEIFWLNWDRVSLGYDWDKDTQQLSVYPVVFGADNAYHADYTNATADIVQPAYEALIAKTDSIMAEMATALNGNNTVYAKVDFLNWWLIQNNIYPPDTSLGEINNKRTAYNAIMSNNDPQNGPVCIGYSYGMQLLAKAAGLTSIIIDGTVVKDGSNIQHGWNRVQNSDGKWYDIDSTWNDSESIPTVTKHFFFMVGVNTDTQLGYPRIYKDNHMPTTKSGFTYPTLSDSRLEDPTAPPAGAVAKVGTVYYNTLQEAFSVAAKTNDVVQLVAKAATPQPTIDLPAGTINLPVADLTLDVNGTLLKTTDSAKVFSIPAGGSLTMMDSRATTESKILDVGGIQSTYKPMMGTVELIENNGTFTLVSGKLVRGRGTDTTLASFFSGNGKVSKSPTSTFCDALGNSLPGEDGGNSSTIVAARPKAAEQPSLQLEMDSTFTYNGKPVALPKVITNSGGIISYNFEGSGAAQGYQSSDPPSEVGKYTVTVSVAADLAGNFSAATASTEFEIQPALINLQLSGDVTQGTVGQVVNLTVKITGLPTGEKLDVAQLVFEAEGAQQTTPPSETPEGFSATYTFEESAVGGKAIFSVKLADDCQNYTATPATYEVPVELSKQDTNMTVKVSEQSPTYGTQVQVRVSLPQEVPAPTGTVEFIVDGAEPVIKTIGSDSLTLDLDSRLSAGEHTIEVKYSGDNRWNPATKTEKLIVQPKELEWDFSALQAAPIAQNSANTTVAVTGTAKLNGILDNDIVFLADGTVITGQYLDVSQPGQQPVKINIDQPVLDGADKGNYSVSSPVDKTIQGQVNAVSLIIDKDSIVPVNPDNVPADTTYFVEREVGLSHLSEDLLKLPQTNTLEKVAQLMEKAVPESYVADVLTDIRLMAHTTGNPDAVEVQAPKGGIQILFPFPQQTAAQPQNYTFKVLHMQGVGSQAGTIEELPFTVQKNGLLCTFESFSPVIVVYKNAPKPTATPTSTPTVTPVPPPPSVVQNTPAPQPTPVQQETVAATKSPTPKPTATVEPTTEPTNSPQPTPTSTPEATTLPESQVSSMESETQANNTKEETSTNGVPVVVYGLVAVAGISVVGAGAFWWIRKR